MKKNIIYALIGTLLVLVACDPIEKRLNFAPAVTEAQLLDYMDIKVDGNNVTCTNNTPGTVAYWKASTGDQKNQKTSVFYFPLKNKYTITLTVYGGDKTVTVSKDVSVEQNDMAFFADPKWNLLTNGATGKTWVWAADIPGGYVWGNGGYLGNREPGWWKQSPTDLLGQHGGPDDSITFRYDANTIQFNTYQPGSNKWPGTGHGTFILNLGSSNEVKDGNGAIWSYGKLSCTNFTIPCGFEPNSAGDPKPLHYKFDILKLTEDELVLSFPEDGVGAWGTAWFYMFKRKGFTYPK
jgi:hypothetical protein